MQLRPYQQESINALYEYFTKYTGNPIVCIPTGGGKSVVIAKFIESALGAYPHTRFLLLSHVKELLQQNYEKLVMACPHVSTGIYSAGLGIRQLHKQVTVAGIQSIYKKAGIFNWIDLIIIDECHLLSPDSDTMYQKLIWDLRKVNPNLKVIGFSATPFRTKDGMLTYGEKTTFTDICYNVPIRHLIAEGYLVPLTSKSSVVQADMKGVKTTGGDFNQKQMQEAVDKDSLTNAAIAEIFKYANERKSWLIFCSGVQHAAHVSDALNQCGIKADFVSGETPKEERSRILADLRSGKLRAVCNYGVLTTGFDAPTIDCIVLLRPTKSVGLYIQMLGRGTRVIYPKGYDIQSTAGRLAAIAGSPKQNCIVLDFAGNIERFGPVDRIEITNPTKRGERESPGIVIMPTKICDHCRAPNHSKASACEMCGIAFPLEVRHAAEASEANIMSEYTPPEWFDVSNVNYQKHEKLGKIPTMRVIYNCGYRQFSEWVCIEHEGFPRAKAERWWEKRWHPSQPLHMPANLEAALKISKILVKPTKIQVDLNKKFPEIVNYAFN